MTPVASRAQNEAAGVPLPRMFRLELLGKGYLIIWKQLGQQGNNTLAVVAQPRDGSHPARGCEPTRFKLFSKLSLLSPNSF